MCVRKHCLRLDYSELGFRQCFCSPISSQEWTRYKIYSQCIKSVSFSPRRWTIHPSALEYISKTNDGAPLLPALQHLKCKSISPLDFSINKFISSTLQVFRFAYKSPHGYEMSTHKAREFHVQLLFDELSVKAHSLKHLTIVGIDQLSSMLPSSVCNRLCKVHLSIRSKLDPAMLSMLASFQSLTDLSLIYSDMGHSTSLVHMAALKRLHLYSHVDFLTRFFKSVRLPKIQSLKINLARVQDPDSSHPLSASIADCCAETLSLLHIHVCAGPPGTHETLTIFLEPLFRMRHLRSLKMDIEEWSSPLSGQDLQKLAEAWPKLTAIDIIYNSGGPREPHLDSLLHFATLCPELRSIHIAPLSTVPIPNLDPFPILSHGLQSISFDHPSRSPITDPRGVALFLDRIFPNIDMAECERLLRKAAAKDGKKASTEDWQEVLTYLSDFRLVRNQQGIRLGAGQA